MMVYTWWCWHIYKGEEVGEEKELKALVMGWPDASDMWTRRVRYLTQVAMFSTWLDASGILARCRQSCRGDRTLVQGGDRTLSNHCSCVRSWWCGKRKLIQRGSDGGRVRLAMLDASGQPTMALGALWTWPDAASPTSGHFLAARLIRCCSCVSELAVGRQRLLRLKRNTWRLSSDRTLRPDGSGVLEQRVRSAQVIPSEGV
jgi:hypothetical protein